MGNFIEGGRHVTTRKILVPISGHYDPANPQALEQPALETAFVIAQGLDAHLEVFCIEADPGDTQRRLASWMPELAVEQLLNMIESENDARRARSRELFETVADQFKAPRISTPSAEAGFSVSFREQTGTLHTWLAPRGRLADLIVTACPPLEEEGGVPPILEISLRETGRPVLISRASAIKEFPKTVAIAWNGSAEAARAVAFAMEFFRRAEEVVVITVEEDGAPTPSADTLGEYFEWHGVRWRSVMVESSAPSPGSQILEQIETCGADLLVMGAYTRNRFARVFFGGVTNEILNRMTVPVLMVD
jgi:nucleotide-binding universal stress UspA family protein